MHKKFTELLIDTVRLAVLFGCIHSLTAQPAAGAVENGAEVRNYTLGPGDEISIRVLDSADIPDKPIRVDPGGEIALPLIGRIQAAGRSVAVLETEITNRLRTYVKNPQVSINITEFGSQPVSVLGSVTAPGVYQLSGTKTLAQVLALAKGLAPDAGSEIRIASYHGGSTPSEEGSGTSNDPKVTSVRVDDLLSSSGTSGGILIRPRDVITVPKARIIYVIGEVHKPGVHLLSNHESISVLEAVSMAEGVLPTAAAQHAKLLRRDPNSNQRVEIALDLKRILAGKAENIMLRPDDILLVPNSAARSVAIRSLEAAIQLGTGIAIWRH
jgi:polysaccharide biosynthesis/export protein